MSVIVIYFVVLYATFVPDWEFTVHDSESIYNGKFYKVNFLFLVFDLIIDFGSKQETLDTIKHVNPCFINCSFSL